MQKNKKGLSPVLRPYNSLNSNFIEINLQNIISLIESIGVDGKVMPEKEFYRIIKSGYLPKSFDEVLNALGPEFMRKVIHGQIKTQTKRGRAFIKYFRQLEAATAERASFQTTKDFASARK